MQQQVSNARAGQGQTWLRNYYAVRFAVAAVWVASAFTLAKVSAPLAVAMLIAYPLWDALANLADARLNGGLAKNRTQAINVAVSILTAVGVAAGAVVGMNAMLGVFGLWALVAGLLQLATGVRRWSLRAAQWAMILSGAQSALAGVFFAKMAAGAQVDALATVAPYAGFGAFYFLVSALWLTAKGAKPTPPASRLDPAEERDGRGFPGRRRLRVSRRSCRLTKRNKKGTNAGRTAFTGTDDMITQRIDAAIEAMVACRNRVPYLRDLYRSGSPERAALDELLDA